MSQKLKNGPDIRGAFNYAVMLPSILSPPLIQKSFPLYNPLNAPQDGGKKASGGA